VYEVDVVVAVVVADGVVVSSTISYTGFSLGVAQGCKIPQYTS
jgi:hypothetical protein